MAIPEALEQLIERAHAAVEAHESRELALPLRKDIWRALGPVEYDQATGRAQITSGLRRRTHLARLAAERVLPIWEARWPTRDPHRMLAVSDAYLAGTTTWKDAWRAQNAFGGGLQNVGDVSEADMYTLYPGHAAIDVVLTALKDVDCDASDDLDAELDEWDGSFYAAAAFAGEMPWDARASSGRRSDFWEWYLREAVPAAWESVA